MKKLWQISAAKKAEIEHASMEGQQFTADCHELLDWISDTKERLAEQPSVSGNMDLLKEQAQQQMVCIMLANFFKELNEDKCWKKFELTFDKSTLLYKIMNV